MTPVQRVYCLRRCRDEQQQPIVGYMHIIENHYRPYITISSTQVALSNYISRAKAYRFYGGVCCIASHVRVLLRDCCLGCVFRQRDGIQQDNLRITTD